MDLWLRCSERRPQQYLLQHPREALSQANVIKAQQNILRMKQQDRNPSHSCITPQRVLFPATKSAWPCRQTRSSASDSKDSQIQPLAHFASSLAFGEAGPPPPVSCSCCVGPFWTILDHRPLPQCVMICTVPFVLYCQPLCWSQE